MATLYLTACQNMREVAALTGFSVWTVHRELTVVLPKVDPKMAKIVRLKIDHNWKIKHRNGGLATRGVSRRRFKVNRKGGER